MVGAMQAIGEQGSGSLENLFADAEGDLDGDVPVDPRAHGPNPATMSSQTQGEGRRHRGYGKVAAVDQFALDTRHGQKLFEPVSFADLAECGYVGIEGGVGKLADQGANQCRERVAGGDRPK